MDSLKKKSKEIEESSKDIIKDKSKKKRSIGRYSKKKSKLSVMMLLLLVIPLTACNKNLTQMQVNSTPLPIIKLSPITTQSQSYSQRVLKNIEKWEAELMSID